MNIPFFKKIRKVNSLDGFHEKSISPEKDWLWILLISFVYVFIAILMSGSIFIKTFSNDSVSQAEDANMSDQSVNIDKLNKALEVINSRGK